MPITLDLGIDQLAATRFGFSPLVETVLAVQALADPGPMTESGRGADSVDPVAPWRRWAGATLGQRNPAGEWLELIRPELPSYPEFLTPSPLTTDPTFDQELRRFCRTPKTAVLASLRRVFGENPNAAARALAVDVPAGLTRLAGALEEMYRTLVAPHWPRIHALLLADVSYRAQRLASGGVVRLFSDLNPDVGFRSGVVSIGPRRRNRAVTLGAGGLVLMPSVFVGSTVRTKLSTSSHTTVTYPARGLGMLWQPGPGVVAAPLARLLGAARARVLATLVVPCTTSSLAGALTVTPSAISQHLVVLRDCGLVRTIRTGRFAVHELTALGVDLLGGESDRVADTSP